LYFRLKAVTLTIPPLRARREDIPLLAEKFLEDYAHSNGIEKPLLTRGALDLLITYDWPGNVRELKNTIESAAALSRDGVITEEILNRLISTEIETESRNLPVALGKTPESLDREMILSALIQIRKDLLELKQLAQQSVPEETSLRANGEIKTLRELEKDAIINALNKCKWNKKKAAESLGISERTLYRKLKEYGIG
jgi:DNA-binding NtrC family response regulator